MRKYACESVSGLNLYEPLGYINNDVKVTFTTNLIVNGQLNKL